MLVLLPLQVVNYGIGGHYEPHYDFARQDEDAFTSLGSGNRIATVLFYVCMEYTHMYMYMYIHCTCTCTFIPRPVYIVY